MNYLIAYTILSYFISIPIIWYTLKQDINRNRKDYYQIGLAWILSPLFVIFIGGPISVFIVGEKIAKILDRI